MKKIFCQSIKPYEIRLIFFDYLRENGYENDIENDEEGKEYIRVITLKNGNIDLRLLKSMLIKWAMILKEFKDYYRSKLAH